MRDKILNPDLVTVSYEIAKGEGIKAIIDGEQVVLEQDWPEYGFTQGDVFDVRQTGIGMKALAMDLITKYQVIREYESYDFLGMNWYCHQRNEDVVVFEKMERRSAPDMLPHTALFCAVVNSRMADGERIA